MTGWTPPGPDGWERARREALAEAGLEHLERFREAARSYVEAENEVVELIRSVGGAAPVTAHDTTAGTRARGWTDRLLETGRRWIRSMERAFRVAADGGTDVPPDRRAALEAAGAPPERLEAPWPPVPLLERRVEDAERLADAMEAAAP